MREVIAKVLAGRQGPMCSQARCRCGARAGGCALSWRTPRSQRTANVRSPGRGGRQLPRDGADGQYLAEMDAILGFHRLHPPGQGGRRVPRPRCAGPWSSPSRKPSMRCSAQDPRTRSGRRRLRPRPGRPLRSSHGRSRTPCRGRSIIRATDLNAAGEPHASPEDGGPAPPPGPPTHPGSRPLAGYAGLAPRVSPGRPDRREPRKRRPGLSTPRSASGVSTSLRRSR